MADLIQLIGDDGVRNPDASFVSRLHNFDPNLTVGWNTRKNRWMIETCVEHLSGKKEHSHLCRRDWVLTAETPDGDMLPLCDKVLEMVKEKAAYCEQFGGATEQGLKNYLQHVRNTEAEMKATRERKMRESSRNASRDNRRQLNEARTLMQRHMA